MLSYTIDDEITEPLTWSVEVTIDFDGRKRWMCFVTPQLLASVGDQVGVTGARLHLGERHVVVVSVLTPAIIDAVLRELDASGALESRTLPLGPSDELQPEYHFRSLRGVVRGKYAARYRERLRVVRLADDVVAAFADEAAVNAALREYLRGRQAEGSPA